MNVVGFKRGYGYLDEVLALAKPFGKVVRHLVLDVRPEVTALRCSVQANSLTAALL